MRMTSHFAPSYDEVVNEWKRSNIDPGKVFNDEFLVHLTAESSNLEGINVSYHSTREIFESESIQNYSGDIRSLFSVLNNRNVASMLSSKLHNHEQISLELILEIHRLMMFGSIDRHRYMDNEERAGEFKKHDYCVGRYSVGYAPEDVPDAVTELVDFVNSNTDKDPLKVATIMHCYIEHIHPFSDGNGRVGRWLLNYYLVLNNHPPIIIPTSDKQRYFDALEAFDLGENYNLMYNLLREYTVTTQPLYRYLLK